jgi:tRNA A-37 threonylcarbamoyl transferase component Bud32
LISGRGDIYEVSPDRRIAVVAGNGRSKPMVDDTAATEVAVHPIGQIAAGPNGEVLFFESIVGAIRSVGSDGILRTFAGEEQKTSPRTIHSKVTLSVREATSVSIDAGGDVWYAEGSQLHRVGFATGLKFPDVGLRVRPDCQIDGIAHHRSGAMAILCEAAGEMWLYRSRNERPRLVKRHVSTAVFDEFGALWFAEANRLYRMELGLEAVHSAGGGFYGDGGRAATAWFDLPHGLSLDRDGNVLVADRMHHVVRRVFSDGRMDTIAGNGEGGHTGDEGPAKEARLFQPTGVVTGGDGSVYILERNPTAIRRVDPGGMIHTVFRADERLLPRPLALALDHSGRLLIGDEASCRIVRVEADGSFTVLAGTGNVTLTGITGAATRTPLGRISGLAPAADGSLLFTQYVGSNLLRRLTVDGRIENLAGSDESGPLDGRSRPALAVGLQEPGGLAELPGEGVLVSSAYQLELLGSDGMLRSYADEKNMNLGYRGIVVDDRKNTYIADVGTSTLRIVRRDGGIAASELRMPARKLRFRPFGRTFGDLWYLSPLLLVFIGAAIPWGVRKWRYRRNKARLLRGVDSDVSAVFSPASASPRAAISGVLEGRYRVVENLASGGSAVVYRAEDLRTPGRMVAVKVFDLPDEDPVAVQRRLLRECVASSRVRHAAVAPMLDVGMTADGQPFLVMEFVAGESLRAVLRRGVLPRERAVQLLGELAEAVAATHAQGVLHLDIKPENLMIRQDGGQLVLIDFGLAAVAEGGAMATHMSAVGGTLDYMAPEQLLGHVSAAADMYACGAVALEMLSGKRVAELELPPNNQDLELTVRRVRAVLADVPEEAVTVLAHMLSLRPEKRPQRLGELVSALG